MSSEWTVENFVEFCHAEINSGGPDPQTKIAATVHDDGWFAGCFVCPYTVGAGIAIYNQFPSPEQAVDHIHRWLAECWPGIAVRRERRTVWAADKLADSLVSYGVWLRTEFPKVQHESYNVLWDSVNKHVRSFGRYATLKLLGTLHQAGIIEAEQPDIRPQGAKYPRRALTLLTGLDVTKGERDMHLEAANVAADMVKLEAEYTYGLSLSWNAFEILLCNYRQALTKRYPGRSNDSELAYYTKAFLFFGQEHMEGGPALDFIDTRRTLFNESVLAEVQDWPTDRKELGDCWPKHGYFWDDTKYDWQLTLDLAKPWPR